MSRNGCKILVVDDDDDNRAMLGELLEAKGYFAAPAANGAEAVALLQGGLDPDLVLTDLMMPTMSGWATAVSLMVASSIDGCERIW